jgi:CRP-like cAMP-binding protein
MNEPSHHPSSAVTSLDTIPLLLKNFPSDDLRHFLAIGHTEHYQKQDVIIVDDNSPANSAYLVVEGRVSVWKDDMHLATLNAGDFIGETFLFSRGLRSASVVAEDTCTVLRFDRQDTLDYFRRKPERLFKIFIMNIVEIQQKKIVNMNQKLISIQRRLLQKDQTG